MQVNVPWIQFYVYLVFLCRLANISETLEQRSESMADFDLLQMTPNYMTPERSFLSPCPGYFRYVNTGHEWMGLLVVPSLKLGVTVSIKLILMVLAHLPPKYVGSIELVKSRSSVIHDISEGNPILYRINFPVQNPLPRVAAIYYNDRLICSGSINQAPVVTRIKLEHNLYTGLAFKQTQQHQQEMENLQEPQVILKSGFNFDYEDAKLPNLKTPPIPQSSKKNHLEDSEVCGKSVTAVTSLIKKGTSFQKGDFPWMAAIYYNDEFLCGGSLVSSKHVVTAAHCIKNKRQFTKLPTDDMKVVLGKYNLNSVTESSVVLEVSQFILHHDWNSRTNRYDADIAIAVLSSKVRYSQFIRPICLPTESDATGRKGLVAGWGKSDNDLPSSEEPKFVIVPIVSDGDCLRSHEAMSYITSNRTFCAGDKKGGGPCNGDSGSPLMLKQDGRWVLRGIVSVSLKNEDNKCDVHNYIVYTDVAKFSDWIQSML